MQALARTIEGIVQQLRKVSVNSRLLIASMVVILLMALLLVSQYAGRSEMAPLGLPASAELRTRAVRFLDLAQVSYEDRGNDIYVPADQRFSILGRLNEQRIVSASEIDFNALIDLSANPFIGRDQARQMWLTAKMNVLSAMISARRDVTSARVIIDEPKNPYGIGRANIASTASVSVEMRDEPLSQEAADAIGVTVAGSHAGLKPEHVAVTDVTSGRSFRPRDSGSFEAASYLEHKQKTEQHYRRMIEDALSHVHGVVVTVNAVIRNTKETTSVTSIDDPKIGPATSESHEYTTSDPARPGEAGVRPNVGQSIRTARSEAQVTESNFRERVESKFGGRDKVIHDPTGYPLQINAFVGIPKSFFVKVFRARQHDEAAEPDSAQLAALVGEETERWKQVLRPLIRTEGLEGAVAGTLEVSMIHDFEPPGTGSATGAVAGGVGLINLVSANGMLRNVMLGVLALVSLLMMLFMVRRASARHRPPSAAELIGLPPVVSRTESDLIGEAEESAPPLEGMEVDDRTIRTRQLLQQIDRMVEMDPHDAAGVVSRWLSRGQGSGVS